MRPLSILGAILALSTSASAQATPTSPAQPLTPTQQRALLLDPTRPFWRSKAPDSVQLDIETSRGVITVELIRAWAPAGVDRFYNLARAGFYDDTRFFRVLWGYIAQFGLAADPRVDVRWRRRFIPLDSVRTSNSRGTITFAQYNARNRTTNIFFNLRDNPTLDTLGFAPIGRVVRGMEAADSLYTLYGERPSAAAPIGNPTRLYRETNKYLDREFPLLDRVVRISLSPPSPPSPPPPPS